MAELKTGVIAPPTLDNDGYSIAVYGIPGEYFKGDPKSLGDPLKKEAVLTVSYTHLVHSEALSCARATSQCTRNVIEFRNYKKFTADTSITFETDK